ncbi:hypothetical protein A3A03_00535 [Candidatus Nomurabacteria bacterium RIFCSPLOWO2_01_FULL_40_18]|uniref:CYTH domain-containing protein n=1 Tax=Candidatus Nomurabacteria bacterium RIFCSPLOWO2_01_FULL_40_18 TaxID=1801773 RepID=A0A1F6XI22_9BACT|nr:MAG: hypothetical protein A3A03_00535 [Candidatus Nomurabacteria bacterium RIFCSPLOWO2_01_FULL_40_18]
MYEVEVKARLRNRKSVLNKLKALGCKFSKELHQIDHIFAPEGNPFPLPFEIPILRVRKSNDQYFFTLKISQSSRQDCIEKEMKIVEGEKMMEILKLIKYKEFALVDKKRIKTKYKGIEIVLDKVKNLGEFIEAEKIVIHENREDRKKVQSELLDFLETIGVSKKDQVIDGKYNIMLYEKLNKK